jgi:integrase
VAWLESNRCRLLVGFRFRGERCREYLGLDDNRENPRMAARILKEIDGELAAGRFGLRRAISQERVTGRWRGTSDQKQAGV